MSASTLQTLPIDSVPCSCPTWEDIAGKAHLYETARLRSTGEYVKLCRVVKFIDGGELKEPVFACRIPSMGGVEHRTTEELCDFCL